MRMTIIGCGNMGSGIAKALSKTSELGFFDRNPEKAQKLENAGYGKAYDDLDEALESSELVILAIKPQNVREAGKLIGSGIKKNQIVVSLLAGTPIKTLKTFFPGSQVIRMMPNLALICGEGVIGLSSDGLKQKDKNRLTKLFKPLGEIYWLPEAKINGLTALTGSAPAFFFAIVEAMIDAGISMGFSAQDSKHLVYQMLRGSLALLEACDKHPADLKWQITSPKGTTIAGLKKLEELALRGGIINTFLAAYDRAIELSLDASEEKV